MAKHKVDTLDTKELLGRINDKPNPKIVKNLLDKITTPNQQVDVKYRGWKNLFNGATKLNMNDIAKAVYLLNDTRTNEHFVPHLLQSGLLAEIAEMKIERTRNMTSLLMSLPYIPTLLSSYGMEELALNRAMFMLESNPVIADKIGNNIADIIQDPSPENKAYLLTKLVDNILNAAAFTEKSHITTAKFVKDFLVKLCKHKIPENYELVAKLDKLIENPENHLEGYQLEETIDKLLSDPELTESQTESCFAIKEQITAESNIMTVRESLMKDYSLMDTLRYNFRDYIGLIEDLNEHKLLVALTGKDPKNTVLLKELNSAFMQFSFNSDTPEEITENLKIFVLAAVNLATEEESAKALTPLVNKDLLIKIFDLPGSAGIVQYKDLVLNLAKDIDKFQDLVGSMLEQKEKLRPAIKDLLDFIYLPNEDAKAKNEAFEKSLFSIVDLVTEGKVISKLIPLVNKGLIKDVFATIKVDSPTAVTTAHHNLLSKAATIVQEVINNPEIQKNVTELQKTSITTVVNEIVKNQGATTVSSTEETFASKLTAHLVRKLPSEELKAGIEKHKNDLAVVIDTALTKFDFLGPILKKCELNGKKITEFLPTICHPKTLKAVANCLENPSAPNITTLVLTDPKILTYAIATVVTFCKNYIKEVAFTHKLPQEVDISAIESKLEKISPAKKPITGSSEIDIEAMKAKVKEMTLIEKAKTQIVDLSSVEEKTEKVVPKGFVTKVNTSAQPNRRFIQPTDQRTK
jgi:hypothetical protein